MAKIEAWLSCDLKKPVQVQGMSGNVFSMDNNGSRINVRIYDNGEKTTVSGSVTANCILADGSTINVNGSLTTDNGQSVAYVDIPQSCLLVPGPIRIAIKLTASGVITTLAAVVTTVYRTQTDIVITPSAQIITDWNAEISAAIATQNATIANQDTKINDLKSAIMPVEPLVMGDLNYVEGYYIDRYGVLNADDGYCVTEKILISGGVSRIYYYGTYNSKIKIVFFGSNDEVLDYFNGDSSKEYKSVASPANTVYVRFGFNKGYTATVQTSSATVWQAKRLTNGVYNRLNIAEKSIDLRDLITEANGLNLKGTENGPDTERHSPFIPVSSGDVINYNLRAESTSAMVALYNSNRELINVVAGTGAYSSGTVTVAQNGYVRFGCRIQNITGASGYICFDGKTYGRIKDRLDALESGNTNVKKMTNVIGYIGSAKYFDFTENGVITFEDTTGSLYLRGSCVATVAIADIFTAATGSNLVTVSGNTISGNTFAIIYNSITGAISFTAVNAELTNGDIVLFAHHYASMIGEGILADYTRNKEVGIRDVPVYYESQLGTKIPEIIENINSAGQDGETFAFITDLHWDSGNMKHSPALIGRIIGKTNLNTMICGGDLINEGTKDSMISVMVDCVKNFSFPDIDFPIAFGNHDDNKNNQGSQSDRWFSRKEVFGMMMKQASNTVKYMTDSDWTFYYDRPGTKTRFLIVDTGINATITSEAKTAICDMLMNMPEGYNLITVGHWLYSASDGAFTSDGAELVSILEAYNGKTTLTGTEYNFAGTNGEAKCIVIGHSHRDLQGVTEGGIPWFLTDCDNLNRTQTTGRTAGNATEQCFDVVTVNYDDDSVKCVRIGNGNNRTFTNGSWS